MSKKRNPFPILVFPLWLLWEVLEGGRDEEEGSARDP